MKARTTEVIEAAKKKKAAKWRPKQGVAQQKRAADKTPKPTEETEYKRAEETRKVQTAAEQQQEEERSRAAAEQQQEESRIAARKKEERKEARKQNRKAIRKMKTTENKRKQAELKALLEEETAVRAERKQLRAYHKQRAETVEVDSRIYNGLPLEKIEQLKEEAAAVKKKDDKRYRENAKEHRRKKQAAAQAAAQAEERELRCLVEGHEGLLEALKFEARPIVTKAATDGGFVKATMNGYFVTMQEAGQGKADEAEAAWVETRERGRDGKGKRNDCRIDM